MLMFKPSVFFNAFAIAGAVFFIASVRAQSVSFGAGCGSPNLTLSASSPRLGSLLTFTTTNIPAGAVISAQMLTFSRFNPGGDLSAFGAPGCSLLVISADAVTTWLFGSPVATNSLVIPLFPSYLGRTLYGQSASLVPGYNPLGVITSNGTASTFNVTQTIPNMVQIPSGSFLMGSNAGYLDEAPVHQVAITQQFWIGRYEVKQGDYQALMGNNPSFHQGANYPGSDNLPVEMVSYGNATAYCVALTAAESLAGRVPVGYQYRLATEAEWEYCCRAGTTSAFNTGPSLSSSQANFVNAIGETTIVGSYAANAFGLYDMHGNVWEWCRDSWDGTGNYPNTSVANPYVASGPYRVFRGGGWYDFSFDCRSAIRSGSYSSLQLNDLGFRVVLAPIIL